MKESLMVRATPPASADPTAQAIAETDAVKALGALAQTHRLRAFRALVVAGLDGLTPGVLAGHLGVAPSALSFHLKELVSAGMASSEARGRHLVYRADFSRMNGLLAYLTEHCCQGGRCEVSDVSGGQASAAAGCCGVPDGSF